MNHLPLSYLTDYSYDRTLHAAAVEDTERHGRLHEPKFIHEEVEKFLKAYPEDSEAAIRNRRSDQSRVNASDCEANQEQC